MKYVYILRVGHQSIIGSNITYYDALRKFNAFTCCIKENRFVGDTIRYKDGSCLGQISSTNKLLFSQCVIWNVVYKVEVHSSQSLTCIMLENFLFPPFLKDNIFPQINKEYLSFLIELSLT